MGREASGLPDGKRRAGRSAAYRGIGTAREPSSKGPTRLGMGVLGTLRPCSGPSRQGGRGIPGGGGMVWI